MNSLPMFKWLIRGLAFTLGLTLFWHAATPVKSQDDVKIAGVLARVPSDAAGFFYINAVDVWKADAVGSFRDMLTKAGPEALAAFNKRFMPSPATLESIAGYVLAPSDDGPAAIGMLATFSDDFDQAKVLKKLLPSGAEKTHFGQKFWEDQKGDFAVKIVDGRTLLFSRKSMMPRLMVYDAKENGPLAPHLAAAKSKAIFAAMDVAGLPKEMWDQIPSALRPLTEAKDGVLVGDLGKELVLKLTLRYADAGAASAADQAARAAMQAMSNQIGELKQETEKRVMSTGKEATTSLFDLQLAIGDLMSLASLKSLDRFLADPPLTKQGDSLVFDYRFDPANAQTVSSTLALAAGVMVPAVAKTREAASRVRGQNNMRQLSIAMHTYLTERGSFPAHAIYAKDKKRALLSWRVALLPYLEQDALFKQFKLDEPWDSDDNKKLIAKMPAMFVDPEAPSANEPGMTHYQVLVGGGAGFRPEAKGTKMFDITDGTSQTIMMAVAREPVVWTKPDDLPYHSNKPLPKLGFDGKAFSVALFDGSVRSMPRNTPERVIRAMITMAGSELIGDDN